MTVTCDIQASSRMLRLQSYGPRKYEIESPYFRICLRLSPACISSAYFLTRYFTLLKTNILENRRRVMKKNVAILADSLPLSTSRHNTMFLKNWQHLL